jgi:hypothetical protein
MDIESYTTALEWKHHFDWLESNGGGWHFGPEELITATNDLGRQLFESLDRIGWDRKNFPWMMLFWHKDRSPRESRQIWVENVARSLDQTVREIGEVPRNWSGPLPEFPIRTRADFNKWIRECVTQSHAVESARESVENAFIWLIEHDQPCNYPDPVPSTVAGCMALLSRLIAAPDEHMDFSPWIGAPEFISLMKLNGGRGNSESTITRKKKEWEAKSQPGSNDQLFHFQLSKLRELGIKYPPEWD